MTFIFKGSTAPELSHNLMLPTSPSKRYNTNVASSEKNPGKLRTLMFWPQRGSGAETHGMKQKTFVRALPFPTKLPTLSFSDTNVTMICGYE
jgi:hypothetical protein